MGQEFRREVLAGSMDLYLYTHTYHKAISSGLHGHTS